MVGAQGCPPGRRADRLTDENAPFRARATSGRASAARALGPWQWLLLCVWSLLHLVRLLALPFAVWAARASTPRTTASTSGAEPQRPVLFLYSQVAWDEVWQRPQEFALRLARHFDVVFFGPLQMHRVFSASHRPIYRQVVSSGDSRVLAITPWTFPGTYKSRLIHRLNRLLLRLEARLACPHSPAVVVCNSPFPDWLPETLEPELLLMDFMDDFAVFDWAPPDAPERQQRLLDAAGALTAGTRFLAQKYAEATGRPCAYLPSGVDVERWALGAELAAQSPEVPPGHPLHGLARPIIGYAGSISSRLDPAIFHALARQFPQSSIVLMGPAYGDTLEHILHGKDVPAGVIRHLGNFPPGELPDVVSRFDVALIPFALNDATRALNPIKAMEYLAAGVPVVATPLPDVVHEYSGAVELAATPAEVAHAVQRVLSWPPEFRLERRETGARLVRERTWQATGDQFTSHVLMALRPAPAMPQHAPLSEACDPRP